MSKSKSFKIKSINTSLSSLGSNQDPYKYFAKEDGRLVDEGNEAFFNELSESGTRSVSPEGKDLDSAVASRLGSTSSDSAGILQDKEGREKARIGELEKSLEQHKDALKEGEEYNQYLEQKVIEGEKHGRNLVEVFTEEIENIDKSIKELEKKENPIFLGKISFLHEQAIQLNKRINKLLENSSHFQEKVGSVRPSTTPPNYDNSHAVLTK